MRIITVCYDHGASVGNIVEGNLTVGYLSLGWQLEMHSRIQEGSFFVIQTYLERSRIFLSRPGLHGL